MQNGTITFDTGKIIVIHTANKCGYANNDRYVPDIKYNDINRNFPQEVGSKKTRDPISKTILPYVDQADIVFDFHEGYDYHKLNKQSIGSTLTTVGCQITNRMSNFIVERLNKNLKDEIKPFTVISSDPKSPKYIPDFEIRGTLDYYCFIHDKNYILTEITGKLNAQPMKDRLNQIDIIIDSIFLFMNTYKDDSGVLLKNKKSPFEKCQKIN